MATPQIQNQSPPVDGRILDSQTSIFLEVVDPDNNLDDATIILKVNGVTAWSGDTQQSGFVVTKLAVTNGFSYEINPDTDLPPNKFTRVDVFAQDLAVETLQTFYTFLVEDRLFPDESQGKSAFEDQLTLPSISTLRPAQTQQAFEDQLTLPSALLMKPTEKSNIEDQLVTLLTTLSEFEYIDNKLDGQSKEYIDGTLVQAVFKYKASADNWNASRSSGDKFYGAAKSGDLYFDGVACGFGDFGTLLGGVRKNVFGISSVDPLGIPLVGAMQVSMQADDDLLFQTTAALSGAGFVGVNSALRWYVSGNFEIQVTWQDINFTSTAPTDAGVLFRAYLDPEHFVEISRVKTDTQEGIRTRVRVGGVDTDFAFFSTTAISGGFKLKRTGSNVTREFDAGGGFSQLGGSISLSSDRVYVECAAEGPSGVEFQGAFRAMAVNAGTVSTKAAWAEESPGTHRGSLSSFPDNAVIIATDQSLNIIDEGTNELWIRFVSGLDKVYDTVGSADTFVKGLHMSDGVMMVAVQGASEGYTLRVDFNQDDIRIHRTSGSAITGAHRLSDQNTEAHGKDVSTGNIISRNNANSWQGNFNQWQIPDNRSLDVVSVQDSVAVKEYRACATQSGVAIFGWNRWNYLGLAEDNPNTVEETHSNNTGKIFWCTFSSTLGLFYVDGSKIYELTKAAIETAFGSTFNATTEKTLPGSRLYDPQYSAIVLGTDVYIPSNEGIYKAAWPGGSFSLFYGRPGSGATHTILAPWHDTVIRLQSTVDGAINLILAAVENLSTRRSQVVAINIDDNTLYSKTPVQFGRAGTIRTVAG